MGPSTSRPTKICPGGVHFSLSTTRRCSGFCKRSQHHCALCRFRATCRAHSIQSNPCCYSHRSLLVCGLLLLDSVLEEIIMPISSNLTILIIVLCAAGFSLIGYVIYRMCWLDRNGKNTNADTTVGAMSGGDDTLPWTAAVYEEGARIDIAEISRAWRLVWTGSRHRRKRDSGRVWRLLTVMRVGKICMTMACGRRSRGLRRISRWTRGRKTGCSCNTCRASQQRAAIEAEVCLVVTFRSHTNYL